jgi:hypothetical protein
MSLAIGGILDRGEGLAGQVAPADRLGLVAGHGDRQGHPSRAAGRSRSSASPAAIAAST